MTCNEQDDESSILCSLSTQASKFSQGTPNIGWHNEVTEHQMWNCCSKKKEWEEAHTLEAWTSAISANVYRSGLIESKRMDILLGHDVKHGDGKAMHINLCLSKNLLIRSSLMSASRSCLTVSLVLGSRKPCMVMTLHFFSDLARTCVSDETT